METTVYGIKFEIGRVKGKENGKEVDFDINIIFCDFFKESREIVNWYYGEIDYDIINKYCKEFLDIKIKERAKELIKHSYVLEEEEKAFSFLKLLTRQNLPLYLKKYNAFLTPIPKLADFYDSTVYSYKSFKELVEDKQERGGDPDITVEEIASWIGNSIFMIKENLWFQFV